MKKIILRRHPKTIAFRVSVCFTALLLGVVFLRGESRIATAQERYESPQTLRASRILPPELLSGPYHGVEEQVLNDGFLNHYKINSKFGQFTAISTAQLRKRVHEINAIAELHKISGTKEFIKSFKESGFKTLEGAKSLITSPIQTTVGVIGGVGKIFQNAASNLFGAKRSEAEDSRLKDMIGFSKNKREYAYQFNVDVYSRNKPLQEQLNAISWAGYAGGLSMSAAMMPIGGAAGMVISLSRMSRLFNEIFRTMAPAELRRMNHKKLVAMGVSKDIADLFINNSIYSPREQTLLVAAMGEMKRTGNRSAFVKFSTAVDNVQLAHLRQRQAEMYEGYNRMVEPIERFVPFGGLAAARTRDNKLVFNVPLDHLVWTEIMARFIEAANFHVNQLGWVKAKHLWVGGTVSRLALEQMVKRGWKIETQVEAGLMDVVRSYPKYEKPGKPPSATIEVQAKTVALGAGYSWGDGKIKFKNREYRFSVEGISLVNVAFTRVNATGNVYDLHNLSDFAGNYVASQAAFAVAGGKGDLTMKNGKGVTIHLQSAQAGVGMSLGASGITIKLR